MRRVLILWADNYSSNLGVRALAQGSKAVVRSAFGDSCVVDFQDFKGRENGVAFNRKNLILDASRISDPIRRTLASYDLVLDTGAGDSFTDIYGLRRFAAIAYVQNATSSGNAKLVLGPQTIGPFNSRFARLVAGRSARRADLIAARDSSSDGYSADALGARPNVCVPDVVFAIPDIKPSTLDRLVQRDVTLNVSGLLWNANKHVDFEVYRRATFEIIESLIDMRLDVSIMPHVLDSIYADNDVHASRDVTDRYREIELFIPTGLSSARAHLAASRLTIGARMHACLNSLSVGTPAVPLAYSRKFAPLFNDLAWPYSIDMRDPVDIAGRVIDAVQRFTTTDMRDQTERVAVDARNRLGLFINALRSV